MSRPILFLLLLLALPGCGPRLEVARDRVLTQIDGLLGEVEVKRKEIDPAISAAEAALTHLAKSRVEVQVRAAQISTDLSHAHDRLSETDRSLVRLRDLLSQDCPVEIIGTTYTSSQLKGMASRTMSARKGLAAQVATFQSTHQRLANVVALLEQREQEGRNRLDALKGLLVGIDAKKVALVAVQEAVSAVEDAGALDFEAIERQIREIESQIDGELSFNEEVLKQTGSLDSIWRDTDTTDEAIAQIDKLLGSR